MFIYLLNKLFACRLEHDLYLLGHGQTRRLGLQYASV